MSALSFLNKNEPVHLPTGGDFVPTGLVGNFIAKVLFSFYSDVDLIAEYKAMDEKFPGTRRKMGAGFRYYMTDSKLATAALERAGSQITNPNQVWAFQAENTSLLNVPEKDREKFQSPVSYDVDILTLRSKKRHGFQLMALPSAVASMAAILGYDTPGFSMAELISPEALFTDEFQISMIGNADTDYKESMLWARRASLWASLGEADPTKYTVGAGGKFDTEAAKLQECLSIVTSTWSAPAWLRLLSVPDPRVDATYTPASGESKRLSIPCITAIYANQQMAQAAAKVELDERQSRADAKANGATSASGGPALPAAWVGMRAEFMTELATYKGKPATVAAKALEVTAEEVKAWREVAQ